MKSLLRSVSVLSFALSPSMAQGGFNAQSGHFAQNSVEGVDFLLASHFRGQGIGWVAGSGGAIAKTHFSSGP
jgi:hypothetical protein